MFGIWELPGGNRGPAWGTGLGSALCPVAPSGLSWADLRCGCLHGEHTPSLFPVISDGPGGPISDGVVMY